MAIRTYEITLDAKNDILPEIIFGRQGDKTGAVQINGTIIDGGVPYNLTGKSLAFKATTAKDTAIVVDSENFNIADAANGKFTYLIPNALWSEAGRIDNAYFSVYDDNEAQAESTLGLIFLVKKAVDMTQEHANNYIAIVDQTIKNLTTQLEGMQSNVDQALKNFSNGDFYNKSEVDAKVKSVENNTDVSSNRAIIGFVDNGMIEVDGPTPDYYLNRIDEIAQKLPANNFNIGFITDNHYQMDSYAPHSLGHYANIAALSRTAKIDAIIAGGDNTNGGISRERTLTEVRQATSTLFNRTSADTDVFFMMGNHDTGIGQNENKTRDTTVSPEELKGFYRTKNEFYGEVRDGDSLYGFKDYSSKKIRVVWLNSYDLPVTVNVDGTYKYDFLKQSSFQNAQLNWLANTALMLPDSEWKVLMFSHAPLAGSFDSEDGQTPISQFNTDVIINVLNAFKNGEPYSVSSMDNEIPVHFACDFSGQGMGTIIAFVSGHVHQDGQMIYRGINCIQTTCSLCTITNSQRVANSYTEDAWDIISVDTTARTIYIYRLGYGTDRNYVY